MDRWAGKIAVITGASSGIGLAIAKAFVSQDINVVGLARRKSKMEEEMKDVKGKGQFYALECDVANEQQVRDSFDWIKKNLKIVHILINNAGIIKVGKIADLEFSHIKQVIDVNLTGLILCSKLAIDLMREGNHESHIVMMNSISGLRIHRNPSEWSTNIYPATKYAVRILAQVIETELYGGNIRMTNISPGAIKTELLEDVSKKIPLLASFDTLEAEDIADAVVYVIGTPPRVQIEELTIKPRLAPY